MSSQDFLFDKGKLCLKLIWADSGYNKDGFVEWVKVTLGWKVEIVE
ncbi:MAG TPA: hypothetical protein VKB35_13690 [Ktedonobacteraceae bacterium]|nr:hypothetical protein [Ktedonobacteraceae bacterium]